MAKTTIMEDRDTQFIILAGIRYAIGRSSYAPWLVTDWVKNHWDEIDKSHQSMIKRDIIAEIELWNRCPELSLGMECDVRTWRDFKAWLEER